MNAPTSIQNFKRLLNAFGPKEVKQYVLLISLSFGNILLDVFGLIGLYITALCLINPAFVVKVEPILTQFTWIQSFDIPLVLLVSGTLVFLFIAKSILSFFIGKWQIEKALSICSYTSEQQYNALLNRGMDLNKSEKSANKIHQLFTIPNSFAEHILMTSVIFLSEAFFLILSFTFLFFLQPKLLLLLSCTILPLTLLILIVNRRKLIHYGYELNNIVPRMFENISNSVLGFVDIRLHNRGAFFKDKFDSLRKSFFAMRKKIYLRSSIAPSRIMESATILSIFLIALFAYKSGQMKNITGILALFASIAFRALPSINRLIGAYNTFTSMSYVLDILPEQTVEPIISLPNKTSFSFTNKIELKNITMGYPSSLPVLTDLNLTISKGQMIGIHGASGSGKTTFLNVLLGFYNTQAGTIMVDGQDIHKNITAWQSNLAYVEQDTFMLSGTVEENIAFGLIEVDSNMVKLAIELTALTSWVEGLENGIKTIIGEKGALISGGQRQRLAIARALYGKANVFVFDESTNAMDSETQYEILSTIKTLHSKGYTIIMVAHDKRVFKDCDVVYELKLGKLYAEEV